MATELISNATLKPSQSLTAPILRTKKGSLGRLYPLSRVRFAGRRERDPLGAPLGSGTVDLDLTTSSKVVPVLGCGGVIVVCYYRAPAIRIWACRGKEVEITFGARDDRVVHLNDRNASPSLRIFAFKTL